MSHVPRAKMLYYFDHIMFSGCDVLCTWVSVHSAGLIGHLFSVHSERIFFAYSVVLCVLGCKVYYCDDFTDF